MSIPDRLDLALDLLRGLLRLLASELGLVAKPTVLDGLAEGHVSHLALVFDREFVVQVVQLVGYWRK
jgi:hypothetical protein